MPKICVDVSSNGIVAGKYFGIYAKLNDFAIRVG